jgi:hypothetical protein
MIRLALIHFPFAYVGPGAGFAFLGSFLTLVLSLLASLASLLLWPFRILLRLLRRGRGMRAAHVRKAIFLGLDGLDPEFTEKLMADGKLPHLARLKEQGSYRRLRTTSPPLSAVAWSTFATGVIPSGHKNEPFWKTLDRHGVGSTILRVPGSFPPDDFDGRLLAAAPDLPGMQGSFSLFTKTGRPAFEGGNRYPLVEADGALAGELPGPGDSILFWIRDPEGDPVLEIQGESYALKPHEYTPWIRLKFGRAHGIIRVLATQTGEDFSLYATAVQIDPEHPAVPISQPPYYAVYLAKLLGLFSTLGMAEDTCALNEGAIDEDDFLAQTKTIQAEREAMFFSALDHQESGVVACVFDTPDRVQHIGRHSGAIERMYCDMDRLVGLTLEYANADTAVFVLSGRGFCSFRRGVNLNASLHQNGYLALVGDEIDWPRSRAYTKGLDGVCLNVPEAQAAALGKVSPRVFEDNVDPSLVPGVLFSNRKLDAEDPGIEDMAPTALRLFGIPPPEWMEGKALCGADCQSAADC